MLTISTILKHYKRPEIQQAMIEHAQNKEVAIKYGENGFGKRPDILKYPSDILEAAKQGATSFHVSEEIWKNPLQLDPMLKRKELNDLRTGFDLIIDIDCPFLEYSKIAGDLIVKALRHHGIKSISTKFSGNKGFHIGVPFEAFPKQIRTTEIIETKHYFPDGVKLIANYLRDMIMQHLSEKIYAFEKSNIKTIMEKTGKKFEELVVNSRFDAGKILQIDTILISSRHLYRMPYSFHEKSGLVSIPIDSDKILEFDKEMAKPENVSTKLIFMPRNAEPNEAFELFDKAVHEEKSKQQGEIKFEKKPKHYEEIKSAIPEEHFPPCIKTGLKGIEDGRKRFMFCAVNFLVSVGWSYDQIEKRLMEWNKKNPEELRETNLKGHIRYHKQIKKKILPPNCLNSVYYKDLQLCQPDNICTRIKNPVNYSKIKIRGKNSKK
ncbi:hypothetical protein KY317_01365 [Candidatus Woesearchaeota archaeon]|nr:hypothetical protein [Candidatus Woesearchaeota archaeon]